VLIAHGTPEARGQCEPEWLPTGTGTNGEVWRFAVYNNELIVAGGFTVFGGQPANRVARWDGAAWAPLGEGLNGGVRDLALYDNELIVAGDFTTAGGRPASFIARWNRSDWAPIGLGMDGNVHCVAVYNGELIAAGTFGFAGGQEAHNIARWNGSSWAPLGLGLSWVVDALLVHNGALYAGGRFRFAGGRPANLVARWDGSSWAPLGSGIANITGFEAVYRLGVYNSEIVAAGAFTVAGGQRVNHIARWNGSAWGSFGSGMGPYCNDPWCRWVGPVAVYRGDLIAGGQFTTAGGQPANYIARWNGSSWAPLGPGLNDAVIALFVHNNELLVGGRFTAAGGQPSAYWARWGCDQACNYLIKKSKPKACDACPPKRGDFSSGVACELVKDCAKKLKETIPCPDGGKGACKLKGKRLSCT